MSDIIDLSIRDSQRCYKRLFAATALDGSPVDMTSTG